MTGPKPTPAGGRARSDVPNAPPAQAVAGDMPKPDPSAKQARLGRLTGSFDGRKTGRRTGRGIGVITIIVSMFLTSAGIRVASGYQDALGVVTGAFAAEDMPVPSAASCPETPAELAEALRLREQRLTAREQAVQTREGELRLAETLLATRLTELTDAEERLANTIARVDGAAEADITRLASVYENMKPKEAAALFEEMDPDFAAGFLLRLRPETAAAIMAGMSSEAAYVVSLVLTGRNANAPRR